MVMIIEPAARPAAGFVFYRNRKFYSFINLLFPVPVKKVYIIIKIR